MQPDFWSSLPPGANLCNYDTAGHKVCKRLKMVSFVTILSALTVILISVVIVFEYRTHAMGQKEISKMDNNGTSPLLRRLYH